MGTNGSRRKVAFLVFFVIFISVSLFFSFSVSRSLFWCWVSLSLYREFNFLNKLLLCSISHWGVPSGIHEASQGHTTGSQRNTDFISCQNPSWASTFPSIKWGLPPFCLPEQSRIAKAPWEGKLSSGNSLRNPSKFSI